MQPTGQPPHGPTGHPRSASPAQVTSIGGGAAAGGAAAEPANKIDALARRLLPREQLRGAGAKIRGAALPPELTPAMEAMREAADQAAAQQLATMQPSEQSGAQSFASLWYSDRLGGPALQVGRELTGHETPLALLATAVELIYNPESALPAEERDHAWAQLQEWQRMAQEAEQWQLAHKTEGAPRDWSSKRMAYPDLEHWRSYLDGAFDQPPTRPGDPWTTMDEAAVQQQLRDIVERTPKETPLRFDVRTDTAYPHSIFAVVRETPDATFPFELDLWNLGWGSFEADYGLCAPAMRYRFHSQEDAGRALLALESAEARFISSMPLHSGLAFLTVRANPARVWSEREMIDEAARTGSVGRVPDTEPTKPQRSGSCAAKGLRAYYQHALGGSQDPKSRHLMALLDLVAASLMRAGGAALVPQEEVSGLRRWLAQIHADYRWLKAFAHQRDRVESTFRGAAALAAESLPSVPSVSTEAVPPLPATSGSVQPPSVQLLPNQLQAGLILSNINHILAHDLTTSVDDLVAHWALYEGWHAQNPIQAAAAQEFNDYLRGRRPLVPGVLSYAILRSALPLVQAIHETEKDPESAAKCSAPMIDIAAEALERLREVLATLPRPGSSQQPWNEAEAIWSQLPYVGDRIKTPQIEDPYQMKRIREQAALDQFDKSVRQRFNHWLTDRNLKLGRLDDAVLDNPFNSLDIMVTLVRDAFLKDPPEAEDLAQFSRWESLIRSSSELCQMVRRTWSAGIPSFDRRPDRLTNLAERTTAIGPPALPSPGTFSLSSALVFQAPRPEAEASVVAGKAMESGGLGHLLSGLAAERNPLTQLQELIFWTPALGHGPYPRVQGNLLQLGGEAAWSRWLDSAITKVSSLAKGRTLFAAERATLGELEGLFEVIRAGLIPPLTPSERRLLEKWKVLLQQAASLDKKLFPSLLSLRVLEANDASRNGSSAALVRAQLEPNAMLLGMKPLFAADAFAGSVVAQEACRAWSALRAWEGVSEPDTVEYTLPLSDGSGVSHIRLDLTQGRPEGLATLTSASQIAIDSVSLPRGWERKQGMAGASVLHCNLPGAQNLQIAAGPDRVSVSWSSTFDEGQRGLLVHRPNEPRKLPKWDDHADEGSPQAPLPLTNQSFIWCGRAAPIDEPDWTAMQQDLQKLPGIFQDSKIVDDVAPRIRVYGLLVPGTLQETARLVATPSQPEVVFPDGEHIPLRAQMNFSGVTTLGDDVEGGRVLLRDLAIRGSPVRATIESTGPSARLHLDQGWTLAPERRDQLPSWLRDLPTSSQGDGKAIAMPLVRESAAGVPELGLLVGAPKTSANASGEMLLLRIRPSGDIALDPETGFASVIALLPHLIQYASPVAMRLLQALVLQQPNLCYEDRRDLRRMLAQFSGESGVRMGQHLELVKRAYYGDQTSLEALSMGQWDRSPAYALGAPLGPEPAPTEVFAARDETAIHMAERTLAAIGEPREQFQQELGALLRHLQGQEEQAIQAVEQVVSSLPPQEAALLQAMAGEELVPNLLHLWFAAQQAGPKGLAQWKSALPNLPAETLTKLRAAITRLVAANLATRSALSTLAAAERSAEQAEPSLQSLISRLSGRLPESLLRQEWLFGLLGRPTQTDVLERWAAAGPGERRLLEVRMGGGKSSLLNPTIGLELAHRQLLANPERPAPVFIVVPDSLEEDAKRLCFDQGWDLMGRPLPSLGSQAKADQVFQAAQRAAQAGLPLTLTQSAWNFAWLETLDQAMLGKNDVQRDQARRQLQLLRSASLLIDEADEALSLQQSYNLESSAPRPLPGFLLQALDQLTEFQISRGQSMLTPLSDEERIDLLRTLAPKTWSSNQREEAARALVRGERLPTGLDEEQGRAMAAFALLTGSAMSTARELVREGHAFGPSTAASLDLVPYQSANWPTDQKFSNPALVALLMMEQVQQPAFWGSHLELARCESLLSLLQEQGAQDPALFQRLEELGLSADGRTHVRSTLVCLQQKTPEAALLRAEIGKLLCETQVTTSGEVLRLPASGSALRGADCVATTGTAPALDRTPTTLLPADALTSRPAEGARSDLLEGRLITKHHDIQSAAMALQADIVIDPNGCLDHQGAVQLALDLARDKQGTTPTIALTWSAGTAQAAPSLERILPGGMVVTPPSAAALAEQPKIAVYQQAQCRGTDLKPSPGEKGVLFLAGALPLRDLLQAAARLRGLVPERPGASPLQTLEIALSGSFYQQVEQRAKEQNSSMTEALRQICLEQESQQDQALLPELFRQDLDNIRQALAIWLLSQSAVKREELSEDCNLPELEAALQQRFHYPSLAELADEARAARGGSTGQREKLLNDAERLEHVLQTIQRTLEESEPLVITAAGPAATGPAASGMAPRSGALGEIANLERELSRWRTRFESQDPQLLDRPVVALATSAVQRSSAAEQQSESQQQQAAEAQAEAALNRLRRAGARAGTDLSEQILRCEARWDPQSGIEGCRDSGLTMADSGIEGFIEYWQQKGGRADDWLLEPDVLCSPAALMPLGAPLGLDDPFRLEPLVLHVKQDDGSGTGGNWTAAILAPQEVSESQFNFPADWRLAAEEGRLLVTNLSGDPLTGLLGAESKDEQAALRGILQQPEWLDHQARLSNQLRPLRALFGCAFDRNELPQLAATPRWAELWLEMSPAFLRSSRRKKLQAAAE